LLRRVHCHVPDLAAISDNPMQAADPNDLSVIVPGRQVNRFTLEFVFLRTGRLVPWFAQDFPAQRIVSLKFGFSGWKANDHIENVFENV
jgi:hypothetical protein